MTATARSVRGRLAMHAVAAALVLTAAVAFGIWQGFIATPITPGHIPNSSATCADGVTATADQYDAGALIVITVDVTTHQKQTSNGELNVPNPNPAAAHTWSVDITAPDWPAYHDEGVIQPCASTTTVRASTTTSPPTTSPSATSAPPSTAASTTTAATTSTSSSPATTTSAPPTSTPSTPASSQPSTPTSPTTVGTPPTSSPTPTTAPHTSADAPASGLPATR